MSNKPHTHSHLHSDGIEHAHQHQHNSAKHHHIHKEKNKTTPWIIFLIFFFGPCEPLIPLLVYPAAEHGIFTVIIISMVFAITTIATMLALVFIGIFGISFIPTKRIEQHIHTLAGLSIFISGIGIQFLGF